MFDSAAGARRTGAAFLASMALAFARMSDELDGASVARFAGCDAAGARSNESSRASRASCALEKSTARRRCDGGGASEDRREACAPNCGAGNAFGSEARRPCGEYFDCGLYVPSSSPDEASAPPPSSRSKAYGSSSSDMVASRRRDSVTPVPAGLP